MRLFCILLCFLNMQLIASERITAYTHPGLFPLAYISDKSGEVEGTLVDLVNKAFEKADQDVEILAIPFARAYRSFKLQPNQMFFPLNRTVERYNEFYWIGPISKPVNMNLYKLKNASHIDVSSVEDAKRYIVGAVRGFSSHQYLAEFGFNEAHNLSLAVTQEQNVERLLAGRIDMIIGYSDHNGRFFSTYGLNEGMVEEVLYVRQTSDLYMAFTLNTSPEVLKGIELAMDAIKREQ